MNAENWPESTQKVAAAARQAGLRIDLRAMAQSTRTAQDAAAACGCAVSQIVKSLVFRGTRTGKAYLLLVAGSNRVDETGIAARIGEALIRPDAAFVRDTTGYAIGGVPPIGHPTPLTTFMDEDLLGHDQVFAAAGTPHTIFAVAPQALCEAAGAELIRVTG